MPYEATVNTEISYRGLREPRYYHDESKPVVSFGAGVALFPAGTPLPDSSSKLGETIVAEWETTEDGIILRSLGLDEEAFGANLPDAMSEFLTSLGDRRESLRQRANHLSDRDRGVLEKLNGILGD